MRAQIRLNHPKLYDDSALEEAARILADDNYVEVPAAPPLSPPVVSIATEQFFGADEVKKVRTLVEEYRKYPGRRPQLVGKLQEIGRELAGVLAQTDADTTKELFKSDFGEVYRLIQSSGLPLGCEGTQG